MAKCPLAIKLLHENENTVNILCRQVQFQTMQQFYEIHLKFNPCAPEREHIRRAGTSISANMELPMQSSKQPILQ